MERRDQFCQQQIHHMCLKKPQTAVWLQAPTKQDPDQEKMIQQAVLKICLKNPVRVIEDIEHRGEKTVDWKRQMKWSWNRIIAMDMWTERKRYWSVQGATIHSPKRSVQKQKGTTYITGNGRHDNRFVKEECKALLITVWTKAKQVNRLKQERMQTCTNEFSRSA